MVAVWGKMVENVRFFRNCKSERGEGTEGGRRGVHFGIAKGSGMWWNGVR